MDELEAIAAQRVGSTIGEWKIDRVLGVGAMGGVFEATRSDGMRAAVKVLHPYLSKVREVKKRFLREGPVGRAALRRALRRT